MLVVVLMSHTWELDLTTVVRSQFEPSACIREYHPIYFDVGRLILAVNGIPVPIGEGPDEASAHLHAPVIAFAWIPRGGLQRTVSQANNYGAHGGNLLVDSGLHVLADRTRMVSMVAQRPPDAFNCYAAPVPAQPPPHPGE